MNVLDTAIQAVLAADNGAGGVFTLSTGGIFQAKAPQGVFPPYTLWQEATDVPGYTFGNTLKFDHFFYVFRAFAVDANTSGPYQAGAIADRLKALLTNPTLTVTGKAVLSARFDRSLPPLEEWDDANNRYIWMRGIIAEIWIA